MKTLFEAVKRCNYWGDSGSGVLPVAKSTGRFLVNHRGAGVYEGGTYGIFGGGIFLKHHPELENTYQLFGTSIPKEHAIEELREETGYSGSINLRQLFVFRDENCGFYYWNFIGECPDEFPVSPEEQHSWEEGGQSRWLTYNELLLLQPKHFGLQALLGNAGSKIRTYGK